MSVGYEKTARWNGVYTNRILPLSRAHGRSCAVHMFAIMLHPKRRGVKWKWEAYVAEAVESAVETASMPFSDHDWKRWRAEIEEAAGTEARYTAERMLKQSGILEWWPNPERAL